MNRYDAVTFDMGYTLVHFYPSEEELYLRALHSLGLHPDPARLREVRNRIWDEFFRNAASETYEPTEAWSWKVDVWMAQETLRQFGYEASLAEPVVRAVKAMYREPGAVRLYPEVPEVLQGLRTGGHALAIISNWSWDLHDYVALTGITDHFAVISASARIGCEKPHPEIFRQTLRQLNVAPERALHVGDSYEADYLGARSVGMNALWLDRAGTNAHTDCPTIRNLTEVLQAVLP